MLNLGIKQSELFSPHIRANQKLGISNRKPPNRAPMIPIIYFVYIEEWLMIKVTSIYMEYIAS
jgi:hypothetical protein